MWPDKTVFILGGGLSLLNTNFDLIKNRRIIAVNNAYGDPILDKNGNTLRNDSGLNERNKSFCYTPRDWVDIVFFGDERWYYWHKKSLREFRGLIVCCLEEMCGKDQILCLWRGKGEGLDVRPRFVSFNKSSGGAAINLGYHFGAKRIVLLGFDMRRVEKIDSNGAKTTAPNWHKDHPAPNKNPYRRFLKPFHSIKKDADKLGLEIINCTPGSALKLFPIMTLEEFIENESKNEKI